MQAVEDLCHHKMAANLYDRLQTECDVHIKQKIARLENQTDDKLAFLLLVDSCWRDHCEQMVSALPADTTPNHALGCS